MPYFPYARQERMTRGREAISARLVANLLETVGASRVLYVDIHNRAIQGFFNIPVDPLSAMPILTDFFRKPEFANAAIVSPDVGRAGMAGRYAELLNLPLVVMHKRRTGVSEVVTTHVVGDIEGRTPIVIDDLMAGGSVMHQIDTLYERGAVGKTYFSITHPILLPSVLKQLDEDERIGGLVCTNTIPIPPEKHHPKLVVISIAPLLAEVIERIHEGASITEKLVLA
jgi:ribose-phosphate pyrophosphokinase